MAAELIAGCRTDLLRLQAARDTAIADARARKAAALSELLRDVPTETIARHLAGYCVGDPWLSVLRKALMERLLQEVRERGLSTRSPAYYSGSDTDYLSAEQYAALQPVQSAATELDLAVKVKSVYSRREYRACDEHEDYDADCDECTVEYSGRRAIAVLTRSVDTTDGTLTASVRVELGDYPID